MIDDYIFNMRNSNDNDDNSDDNEYSVRKFIANKVLPQMLDQLSEEEIIERYDQYRRRYYGDY